MTGIRLPVGPIGLVCVTPLLLASNQCTTQQEILYYFVGHVDVALSIRNDRRRLSGPYTVWIAPRGVCSLGRRLGFAGYPRLVAAVADNRLKVQLNETSSSIASDERLLLVRETSHRMRRGVRVGSVDEPSAAEEKEAVAVEEKLASTLNTKSRPRRYYHSVSVPIR